MAAFDRLYARHERPLFGFILRRVGLGERGSAEEIFHDVFVQIMAGAEARFDETTFGPWLYRTARNRCANWWRSRHREDGALDRLGDTPRAAPDHPELRLLDEERATELARAVEQFPDGLAEVFALRSSGLSGIEIAEELQLPVGTVKSRMHALIAQLKGNVDR